MEALNPLKKTLEAMNIENSQELIEKFRIYMEGVLEWNEKVNLTTITDLDEFVIKHFIDSIICANYPEYVNAAKIIDVGTGAGFPGIPLSIISPEKEFILMDSLNKRLKIIDELCQRADIKNVVTHQTLSCGFFITGAPIKLSRTEKVFDCSVLQIKL